MDTLNYIDLPRCLFSVTIWPVGGTGVQGPVQGLFKSFPAGGRGWRIPTCGEFTSFPSYGFEKLTPRGGRGNSKPIWGIKWRFISLFSSFFPVGGLFLRVPLWGGDAFSPLKGSVWREPTGGFGEDLPVKGFPFNEPTGGFFGGAVVVAEHSDNKK